PLAAACAVQRAAAEGAVVGEDADRTPREPREPGHLRAPVARTELEERAAIDDVLDHAPDLVGAAALARDDRQELFLGARGRIVASGDRRQGVDARRQVREEGADLAEGVG